MINEGIFPEVLKIARMTPIFKKDAELIELITALSRSPRSLVPLEKLTCTKLYIYSTESRILFNITVGFLTRSLNWPRNYWFCSENGITNGFRENILLCILLYILLYSILLVRIYWSLKSILHCNSQYFQRKYVAEYNIITCICHLDNLQQLMDHLSLLSVVTVGWWIPNKCWLLIKLLLIWI